MDLSVLLGALTAADQGAKESNPFAPIQSAADGIGQALLQNAGNFSTSDNVWGGLATGLASGLLGNLSDGYRDTQNKAAQEMLIKAASGQSVFDAPRPEGMSPSVFAKMQNTGSLFALSEQLEQAKEKRQLEAQTAEAITKAKALAPIELENDLAKQKALLELQRAGGLGGLPPALQDDYLKQTAIAQQTNKAASAIDDYFEKAKQIKSYAAMVPGTTSANDMQGIQTGLTNMLQAVQGREMNDSARKSLQATLPDWNDTADQIENKKLLFKQMMTAIAPSTPLVPGAVQMPSSNAVDPSSGQIPPGMKIQRNKATGQTRLVPQ
jgi:hypothetical protein